MKASKFSDAQKAFILKQGEDGTPVAEICRKAGISQATFFNWRKKYKGLLPDEMRRLKALDDENCREAYRCRSDAGPCEAAGPSGLRSIHWIDLFTASYPPKARSLISPRTDGGLMLTLPGSASLSTVCWWIGGCRSGARARRFCSTPRPITTNPAAPARPHWNVASRRSARHACATDIGACTLCFCAKDG